MISKSNRFKRAVANPIPVFKNRLQEQVVLKREQQEIRDGHGPVKILVQGGKKCNIVIK